MSAVSQGSGGLVAASVRLLNQPTIKEGIKSVAGTVTFAFGIIEIYDVYKILRGREVSSEDHTSTPKWMQVANKVIIVCAKLSLILSAGVSRPGVFIISSLLGSVFSTEQLDRVFGPNTVFAVNPWHPRHVVSIAAVILALPSVGQAVYRGINWVCKSVNISAKPSTGYWLTDTKVRFMTLFNTVTSRPILHIGNQLGRIIARPA